MKRLTTIGIVWMLMLCMMQFASAQFLLSPQSGDVYKEFSIVNQVGDNSWRVTAPASTFNGNPPGNNPSDFLPNPTLSIPGVDLAGATRAELIIDMWGGHLGTTPKQVHFKNPGADTTYITIPEITSVPDPVHGQCYMSMSNNGVAIPLNQLVSGTNLIQATAGLQDPICGQNFGWGQWGWYGMILRVYYNPATKAHPTGTITSPTTGGSFGENPLITATASGGAGIASVDFVGYYTSYDVDGDGRLTDWQHNYHRGGGDSQMFIKGHIGTATSSPYQVTWNTDWVPDQAAGSIKLHARIRDNNGVYYVTPEVSNLTLARTSLSVKLYTVFNLPGGFWVRNSSGVGVNFNITENLANATAARVLITTWNGANCDGGTHITNINNVYPLPGYGGCNFWSYDVFDFPPTILSQGQNGITVYVESQHHGVEVMVPGPAVMVRYNVASAPAITTNPSNQTVNAGQTASFSVAASGTDPLAYQWQKNSTNIGGATGTSYTTPATIAGDNGTGFRCIVSNALGTVTSDPAVLTVIGGGIGTVGGPWWNTQWHYRQQIASAANGFARTNKVVNFNVNFTNLLTALGQPGPMNDQSIRVIEVDGSGNVIDQNVVFQFDHDPAYNAGTNASGIVAVMMAGTTAANATRYFHIYFDTGSGFSLPSFSNQLTLTDNVFFAGQSSYQINNQLGTLYYHKVGGGFAGMRDLSNTEWIGFDPTSGSHANGEYRGIPNMGQYGHPGYTNGSSTILSQGPIKATIQTVTTDGSNASWIWEFYPTYQTMTLQQTGVNYWLLYEGTPSGAVDQVNGFIKNSAGQNLNLGSTFAADLPAPEWAYFGKTGQSRFMFLAHHEDDNLIDHYRPFFDVGLMTVFGFGRDGSSVNRYLSQTPAHLTFGFGENESQSAAIMDNAFRDLLTGNAAPEQNVTGPPTITQQPTNQNVIIGQTATFTIAATGTTPLGYQWQRNNANIGGATNTSYTTGTLALSDSGATFRCIVSNSLGTLTSNTALLSVSTAPVSFTSDDFSAATINTSLWTIINPATPSTIDLTGTGTTDALLRFQLPASSHDVWTGGNFAPRLMQQCGNVDFTAEVKFQSTLANAYQMQGMIIEQDANTYLRFDFLRTPTGLFAFSASFSGGNPTQRINSGIASANPLWMRVNRTGNTWTMSYSTNGTTYTTAGTYSQALTVAKIGPFAGNAGSPTPATTVTVDYFFNTLSPINPEDPTGPPTPPSITTQPTNQTVNEGSTAAFTVAASGSTPLAYQWQKNNADIPGANGTGYTTPATVFADSGSTFRCVVSNSAGTVTSNSAILSVNRVAPNITLQPANQAVTVGQTASFTVAATGSPTLAYQWQKNNANIGGATNTSYTTPATVLADSGSTFRCIISNAIGTATSNSAILSVTTVPASFTSDDFSAATINQSLWTIINPAPVSTIDLIGTGTTDALLRFQLPASAHDVWTGGNFAPRLMQTCGNVDFTAEVKFQSTLANAYQMQGIIVEQDANNYLRFDFLLAPSGLFAYSASFSGGNPTQRINAGIASSNPLWMRVNRTGNTWTMSYSTNGTSFTTAGTYSQTLTVAKIGPFAGNAGGPAPATTVLVDYFFNTASPINPEDPTTPVAPTITTQPSNQTVQSGQTATFTVVASGTAPLGYQWQKNNANIGGATNTSYTTPVTVHADSGATFRCIVSNALGTVTSNAAILTVTPGPPPSTIVSDDFHTGTLNGALWTYINPLGDATMSLTGANTVDALLNIALPGGTSHDLYTNGYQVPRIMQNANNVDFTVEAKFQSTFTAQYESEGIVVEQDANNVIRFDIFYDGANTNVFAASFIGGFGAPTVQLNANIGSGAHNPAYLRINRAGNAWTVSTSFDGTTFTPAGNFTLAFTVAKVGVWAGNSGTNPAFTMLCDYFFNNASPIVPEDPTGPPAAPSITQQPTNQTASEGQTATFNIVATGNPAPAYQWQKNNANIGGATNSSYTTPATVFADSGATFRCIVSNTQGTLTSNSAILSVNKVGPSITQQPRDTTVLAGQTAAFSVTAAGSPTLAYQWQKNNANIGGATSANYTTPATVAGDNGSTFRCIVSNSIGTVTSNSATLTVNSQPAGTIVSDDFHTGVLNGSLWTFVNPNTPSTLSFTGVGTTDALLSIAVPAGGSGHDVWTGGNFAPRIMQNINNGDFQAEVKFQSALTNAYQMQGIIVEQDANNYLRFDFLRTQSNLVAYSASFSAGNPTQRISTNITGVAIMWMRVTRSGNTWTMAYSTDGTNYTTAGTYTQALTVTKIGPFAGNASGAGSPALTCLIDYFFNTAFPINPEDPVGPVITQQPANQTVSLGNTATFSVTATGGSLNYQWQKNNADIGGATLTSYTTPATVHADSGATFRCVVSNALGTVTSNSAVLTVLPPATPSTIVSDDFHTGTLNGALWTYVNPLADATMSLTGANTVDALLNIALPGGTSHDLFTNGYQVPRIMQNANNTDFTVEAKFQSTFTAQFESEGIVVEQDANNVIRFDIYYDGANTNVFAASFIGGFGSPAVQLNSNIGSGAHNPAYLRINRTGNTWTVSTSFDGTTFTPAGNFTLAFTVAKVGVWAGNSGTNPAFTMLCDYFFNNASPIVPEDPTAPPAAPSITQQPANQVANEGQTATFNIVATGNPAPAYQWQKNNANVPGATNSSYTTPATVFADSGATFRCIVSNTQGTVTSNSAILSVNKAGPSIAQQPRDTTVLTGQTAAFSVTATGSPTLAYQWQKNNANIGGATNATYTTPATVIGDNASTFRCIVSNAISTVTSNSATLTVNSQPAGTIVSDDFHTGVLNGSLWTFVNPNTPSTLSFTGVGTTDALLSIAVPAGGSGHDVWTGGNFAPRIMQNINNGDFQAEVKFQSALTNAYQMQGIIVEQDANNYLRFDFLQTPSNLVAFSASFSAGNPTQRISTNITGVAIMWMRVTRSGNNWTMAYSTDGIAYTTAGTYAQALTVAKIGPFAGNAPGASSPALTCLIDYFFNTAFPINPEDPTTPVAPTITTQPSNQTVQSGQTATFTVVASGTAPLGYQWQKNNANIGGATNTSYTTPATVLADSGSTFRCIVSNAIGTVTSNSATLTVNSQPAGTIVSDDFHTGVLNGSLWTFVNPNTPSTLSFTGVGTTDALLSIAVPAGGSGHDVWTGGNFAPRIMQNINNGDFQAEVKFQSALTNAYQMQGIIVEQDANNYLRFDFLQTPSNLVAFSASFSAGNPTQRISTNITGVAIMWMRVTRSGNNWTMAYSTDGIAYTTAGTYAQALTVAKIGPFAGNAPGASSPALTCLIDYFFNTAFPINPEDPTTPVAPTITTQPSNQTVQSGQTATFTVVASGTAPLGYQWQKNNADIGGATNPGYTTPVTVHADSGATFRCIVSNALGTVTSNAAILTVTPGPPPSTIVSDDFHTGTLNGALWTYINPLGDATMSLTGANTVDALLNIALPGGTSHDLYTNGYQVPRIMQNANNVDFTVEAKFQSTFTAQYESEGIVVEQDANNVIRFDIFYDGANTNVFAASFIGGFGAPTVQLNANIGSGAHNPAYLRINRAGNAWTVSTSFDGTTFTPAGNFTLAFTVAKVGVWAGNSGTNPAFTMLCDYFFNNASPIVPEDPTGPPAAPSITQQPTNQTASEGQTATFNIVATGNPAPAYQWQKNNANIGGATNSSYTTPATVFADSGATFRCIVSNTQGTLTSNSAILSVNKVGPSITQQPRDTTVLAGQTAAFSVTAAGSPTLAYQWQKNNANIGGATSANYTTPATVAGDNGSTFRCIVSNSIGTVTSNSATLTVNSQPAGTIVSDDFHTGVLNGSLWTFVNPNTPSTLSFTGVGTTDALLSIAVPAGGSGHDVWTGGNFAPRIMQNINNGDFQAEVKFQSALTNAYQMQGIIVEQDANNYLRFDFLRTQSNLVAYSASFSAGNPTQRISTNITGVAIMWMRVTRSGNTWTMAYSTDGTNYTTAGTYTQALTVTKIGPFAGNASGAGSPALTCLIDYFFNTAFPINPEDPVGPVITQQPANQTVSLGNTATFSVTATGGSLNYQWQKNNADIGGATLTSYTTPATVHADSGATFRCVVSNALGTVTSNSAVLTVLPPATPSTIVSDDFHTGTLNGALWTYVNPLADATMSLTGANTVDALLNIALPGGTSHDLFTNGYQVPRIMQNANNTDFTVEAKFQSTFTAQFESEGIVVEQDANNVIRFDIYYDGANTNVFAASFIGGFGSPAVQLNSNIGSGAHNPAYLRINRTGNTWTVSTSFDGTTFTPAGNFTLAFTVAKVGVWAGNSGTNPAFTMLCDYFFNNASPIVPEDPTGPPAAPSITQQPANQVANEGQTATFNIVATGNPAPAYQWQKNNANVPGATNPSYTTPATVFADSGATFRCIVSNTQGTVTSNSAILSVNKVGPSIAQQPRDTTVLAGQTAAFSVTATGSPTLAYQWQKNNANIGGATNATYTTPATVAGDNASTFRCIVSNSIATVTSNSATLTVNSTPIGQPISDDFSAPALNGSLWTITNPAPASTISVVGTGTTDALLSIAVPAGAGHDVWTGGNQAPRIMQTIQNQDFQVEAKFQSVINQQYELEGILVQQDASNFLRFDFTYDGSSLRVFSASFAGGNPTVRINTPIAGANPIWLRVNRTGNTWTAYYSTNGTTFTTAGSYSQTLTTSSIGVFGGNQGNSPTTAPAFTMLCDYFFNTAFPIIPEDPTGPTIGPAITQQPSNAIVSEGGRATFTVTASGSPLNYQWQKDGLSIPGATAASYTAAAGVITDDGSAFRCLVSNSVGTSTSNAATLNVTSLSGNGLNVWFSTSQSFGSVGHPIPYVNIVGHAADANGIQSLTYSLNGGPVTNITTMVTSSDGRRIDQLGDFNIEIPRTSFNNGFNSVVITLTNNLSVVTTKSVNITYQGGSSWPLPYSIDWSTAASVQSVAQPSDGFWALDSNGVRIVKPGYDRLLTIGDPGWTNFEVAFPFTIHSFTSDGFGSPSNGPGIGAIVRWNGNTDDPIAGASPRTGYLPLGSIGWYHWSTSNAGNMQILNNAANVAIQDNSGFIPTPGVRYMFKMKVYSSGAGQAPTYRMKIWPSSQSEPASWSLSYTGAPTDPSSGCVSIIAAECDVTIGTVSVVPAVDATTPRIGGSELLALYRFNEGDGNIIHDVSGKGTPLDLTIDKSEAVSWTPGGLAMNLPAAISSQSAAAKVLDAVHTTNAFTVEAWLKPTLFTYNTASRIVSFGNAQNSSLAVLHGISADRSSADVEASMQINALGNSVRQQSLQSTAHNSELTHIMLTRDGTGLTTLYVNGVEQAHGVAAGNLDAWKNVPLIIGGNDAWLGEYKLIAIYSRALSKAEVGQNFTGGPEAEVAQPLMSNAPTLTGPAPMIVQEIPKEFALYQNYPNPFNPSTTIKFDLPKDENVSLTVYNLLGQQIATLVNERRTAGRYTMQWTGQGLASGVYIYRIKAGDFSGTKKLVLLK